MFIQHCSKRPFLYFLSVEILILGRWAEDVFGNGYFARSGAIVALLAIGLLWLWLHYGKSLEDTKNYVDAMGKLAGRNHSNNFQTVLDNVALSNPNLPVEMQQSIAANVFAAVTQGPQLTSELKEVSHSLGFSQIEVAAIGTFIWAFGDLFV